MSSSPNHHSLDLKYAPSLTCVSLLPFSCSSAESPFPFVSSCDCERLREGDGVGDCMRMTPRESSCASSGGLGTRTIARPPRLPRRVKGDGSLSLLLLGESFGSLSSSELLRDSSSSCRRCASFCTVLLCSVVEPSRRERPTHRASDIRTFPAHDMATPIREDVETLARALMAYVDRWSWYR